MLFNSLVFLIFFSLVYTLYLLLRKRHKLQNILILIASYIFYGWWDWRFLSLIAISTVVDFFIGWHMGAIPDDTPENRRRRKRLLWVSIILNLGFLGFFKYFNFFAESAIGLLNALGIHADPLTITIILPVGISFYTFQTMSYNFDIYRKELEPTHEFVNFAAFVAFFPQLVAGPIERAHNLLPQFARSRQITAEMMNTGLYLILWGYFKKTVIGDRFGAIADHVFNNYTEMTGLNIIVGVLAFTIQIYGDFSGYSDIARGIARLMGFDLMVNFRLPYFAMNPGDFWNRWHISLSTWLRDYLYIPLGGNRKGMLMTYRNLMITMVLGGLWHGAAWNFVIWGGFHGLILAIYRRFEKRPVHKAPWSGEHPYGVVVLKWGVMFVLTMIGWLIFRARSVEQITFMLTHWMGTSLTIEFELATLLIIPFLIIEGIQYVSRDLLVVTRLSAVPRGIVYGCIAAAILLFSVKEGIAFIYFQF